VVLPWYLAELNGAGIRPRALGARVWLPLAGAALAGLCAIGARKIMPTFFTACLIGGIATLLIIALLVYHMRPLLSMMRRASGDESAAPAETVAPPSAKQTTAAEVGPTAEESARALALLISLAVRQPEYPSLTGPIPIYRDIRLKEDYERSPVEASTGSPLDRRTVGARHRGPPNGS
jgi:hypothetical protein